MEREGGKVFILTSLPSQLSIFCLADQKTAREETQSSVVQGT